MRRLSLDSELPALRSMIEEALTSFEAQHPDVPWATLGVDCVPRLGSVCVAFDTLENSGTQARVRGNSASFFAKGHDRLGAYCNNCVDFAFPEWRVHEVPEWEDAFSAGEDLEVACAAAGIQIIGQAEGDSRHASVFLLFLRSMMKDLEDRIAEVSRHRSPVQRIGVQIPGTDEVDFWVLRGSEAERAV